MGERFQRFNRRLCKHSFYMYVHYRRDCQICEIYHFEQLENSRVFRSSSCSQWLNCYSSNIFFFFFKLWVEIRNIFLLIIILKLISILNRFENFATDWRIKPRYGVQLLQGFVNFGDVAWFIATSLGLLRCRLVYCDVSRFIRTLLIRRRCYPYR